MSEVYRVTLHNESDATRVETPAEAMGSRLLSIQNSMIMLLLASIVLGCGLTAALLIVTYDEGLQDTCEISEDSRVIQLDKAMAVTDRLIDSLVAFTSLSTQIAITQFLSEGFAEVAHLQKLLEGKFVGIPKDATAVALFAAEVWPRVASKEAAAGLGFPSSIASLSLHCAGTVDVGITTMIEGGMILSIESDGHQITIGPALPVSGLISPPYRQEAPVIEDSSFDIAALYLPYDVVTGMTLGVLGVGGGFTIGVRLKEGGTTTPQPYCLGVVSMSFSAVTEYLRLVANRTEVKIPGSRPRLYTVVASSWVLDAAKEAGASQQYAMLNETGKLTGASHGNVTVPVVGVPGTTHRLMAVSESDDHIIQSIDAHLNSTYEATDMYTEGRGMLVIPMQTDGKRDVHYVSIARMDKMPGIDWWLVTTIDEYSVGGQTSIELMHESMRAMSAMAAISDDIDAQKMVTFGVVCCIAMTLIALAVVLSHAIMKPIKTIQKSMEEVAQFNLDDLDNGDKPSIFYEAKQMQVSFLKMVTNLVEYRAFVPQSLLTNNMVDQSKVIDAPKDNITVMFTDIQQSTQLWKRSDEHMDIALEQHNTLIRRACLLHNGYEVKTIGDAFMVAFADLGDAVKCGLMIFTEFKKAEWPDELGLPPAGLVIRIGVHHGPVITEENPVTRRVDYRGSTVNKASRIEGLAMGGTICLSKESYTELKSRLPFPRYYSTQHGVHELKGLGKAELYLVTPPDMKHRCSAGTDCHKIDSNRKGSILSVKSGVPQKMGVQVSKSSGCVAVCQAKGGRGDASRFDDINAIVRLVSEAANSSDGVVGALCGNTMTVSWGLSKQCAAPGMAVLTFLTKAYARTHHLMTVGVGMGSILHGNVGTVNRFATVAGFTLDAAFAVASHCVGVDVFCLIADTAPHGSLHMVMRDFQHCVRLVDSWHETTADKKVHIYDILLRDLNEAMSCPTDAPDNSVAIRVTALMRSFLGNNVQVRAQALKELQEIAERQDNDKVLRILVKTLGMSDPVDSCRVSVAFGQAHAGVAWAED